MLFPAWHNVRDDDSFEYLKENDVLLAHYTSMENLLNIIGSEQIWLSHPLLMNDVQEMRYGIELGRNEFLVRFSGDPRFRPIVDLYQLVATEFEQKFEMDTYVFCFTQHNKEDNDGMLSMWRGYGDQGRGAALVINNKFVDQSGMTPILIPRVRYLPDDKRRDRINQILDSWSSVVIKAVEHDDAPPESVRDAALYLFDALIVEALSTKHVGFAEEREWRLVYLLHRDFQRELVHLFGYHHGRGGLEPKLKLPIKPPLNIFSDSWSFKDILDRIIIGPSVSSPMAKATLCRALKGMGKEWVADKVVSSAIPFRRVPVSAGH